jgi:hypothetical protein
LELENLIAYGLSLFFMGMLTEARWKPLARYWASILLRLRTFDEALPHDPEEPEDESKY